MISLIVATDQNGLIGNKNALPWHLPADLTYFKEKTKNNIVIMGRKTFESIGKPLPNRINIVITRDQTFQKDGILVEHDIEKLIKRYTNHEYEVFVVGGETIYKQFYPHATKIYKTVILEEFEGDAYFPEIDEKEWINSSIKKGIRDEKNKHEHLFFTYLKKSSSYR